MLQKAITIQSLTVKEEHQDLSSMMNEIKFEAFYNEHSRPLRAYVRRLANTEIADDIMQESFLRFLGAPLRPDVNEKAYLYRIATNQVYDHFRRHSREAKRQTSAALDIKEEAAHEPTARERELTQVLGKLKVQERALLWLAYVEGHDHNEIAEMLGLRPLSVRVLLFRARRKLIGLLETKSVEGDK
jgi:RNA polymerase sigma-70 factor (ECF subfamily)